MCFFSAFTLFASSEASRYNLPNLATKELSVTVMWIIVLCFAAGILLGRLLRARTSLIRLADQLAMMSILFLLFVLGLSVGLNREALTHFGTLGLQAAVLTLGAILGSVAAVQLLNLSARKKR